VTKKKFLYAFRKSPYLITTSVIPPSPVFKDLTSGQHWSQASACTKYIQYMWEQRIILRIGKEIGGGLFSGYIIANG
jgi:hypothetical protein